MLDLLKYQFESLNIDYQQEKFLVGVSGGIDSMSLLFASLKLNLNVQVAHINYNLRAKDAIRDQELVEQFCSRNSIVCHVKSIPEQEIEGGNLQDNARKIRMSFFDEVMNKHNIQYLLLAHHKDDQIENILLNILRGIGPKMMTAKNQKIIRPFLESDKETIRKYAEEHEIPFRVDLSNKTSKYNRNLLRNEIIPKLESKFDRLTQKLSNFGERYWADIMLLEQMVIANNPDLEVSKIENGRQLYYLLKRFDFGLHQCEDHYTKGLNHNNLLVSKTHKALIFNGKIHVHQLSLISNNKVSKIEKTKLPIHLEWSSEINVSVELTYNYIDDQSVIMDYDKITFPIIIRTWIPGDKMVCKGMKGKRKSVKKIFLEHKLNQFEKEMAPIFVDAENELIAIQNLIVNPKVMPDSKSCKYLRIRVNQSPFS